MKHRRPTRPRGTDSSPRHSHGTCAGHPSRSRGASSQARCSTCSALSSSRRERCLDTAYTPSRRRPAWRRQGRSQVGTRNCRGLPRRRRWLGRRCPRGRRWAPWCRGRKTCQADTPCTRPPGWSRPPAGCKCPRGTAATCGTWHRSGSNCPPRTRPSTRRLEGLSRRHICRPGKAQAEGCP